MLARHHVLIHLQFSCFICSSAALPFPTIAGKGTGWVGVFTRLDQILGHLAELDVEMLGGPAQDVERLLQR